MKYTVKGKNVSVSDAMLEKAKKKIDKFAKFFKSDYEAEAILTFKVEKGRNIFEATIHAPGALIRAEESSDDMYASIDLVEEKLERQLRKHKTRLGKKIRQDQLVQENFNIEEPVYEEEDYDVVKTKRFPLKPMNIDEAILQMSLLGHSFFVFINSESEKVNVVYKRKDGRYGLIEPEF